MNKLFQLPSCLIASDSAVQALSSSVHAKILVLSDSHGATLLVKRILDDFGSTADAFVFCGDGAGNVLAVLDEADKNPAAAEKIPGVFAFVQGNNDSDRYPVEFKPKSDSDDSFYHEIVVPKSVSFCVCGHTVLAVHGHSDSVYYSTDCLERKGRKLKADLILYGHTHIAKKTETSSSLMVNPGSISLPRGGLPPSFAVVDIADGKDNMSVTFYKIEIFGSSVQYEPFIPKDASLWW